MQMTDRLSSCHLLASLLMAARLTSGFAFGRGALDRAWQTHSGLGGEGGCGSGGPCAGAAERSGRWLSYIIARVWFWRG
jgi:hypothetical protein